MVSIRSKRVVALVSGAVAVAVPLSFGVGPVANAVGSASPAPAIKITQNYDETVVEGDGISCNDTVTVADNQYYRRFDLNTYGAANGVSVSSISMAVETVESSAGNVPGSVAAWQIDKGDALTIANLEPLASVRVNWDSVADGATLTTPISATVAAGKDLVLEATVDRSTTDELFFPGANEGAELGPVYLTSEDCGVSEPTPIEDLVGVPLSVVLYAHGKTTDCKNAESAVDAANAAVASANAAVTKASKKVKKANKKLKKAKKSGDAKKIKKAKKAVKKAKKALKKAKAAAVAAQAAVAPAVANATTKCAQPALPPAPAPVRPSQGGHSTGAKAGFSFSSAR